MMQLKNQKRLLKQAELEGQMDAEKQGGIAPVIRVPRSVRAKQDAAKEAQAKKEALAILHHEEKVMAKKAAGKKAAKAAAAALRAANHAKAARKSQKLKQDKRGLFGSVNFGISKAESLPSTAVAPKLRGQKGRSAMYQFDRFAPKRNIYGRKKSCLKDIAAHFDEKDLYEQKKLSLIQQASHAKSTNLANKLRRKLVNLEQWHQMMQEQFRFSAKQRKKAVARENKLFDAHLPQELKDQLAANKVAKHAGRKIPFPNAHNKALQTLKKLRRTIEKDDRMREMGHKKIILPYVNDPNFPSRDRISSHLREKLYRRIETEKQWSLNPHDMEHGEKLVEKAHKDHGDFIEGKIAAPILKGKLYKPEVEPLGVPDYLHYFPWPKVDDMKATIDDKVKVEQMYHQTW